MLLAACYGAKATINLRFIGSAAGEDGQRTLHCSLSSSSHDVVGHVEALSHKFGTQLRISCKANDRKRGYAVGLQGVRLPK